MKNKLEIIETKDYILAVSDEEIELNNLVLYNNKYILQFIKKGNAINITDSFIDTNGNWQHLKIIECKKIIAYQPKGNAPELYLPLLPDFQQHILNVIKQK